VVDFRLGASQRTTVRKGSDDDVLRSLSAMGELVTDAPRKYFQEEFIEDFDDECPACDHGTSNCGSLRRVARFYLEGAKQIGFFCDQGHTCHWLTGGHYIHHHLFADGELHASMRPVQFEITPSATSSRASLKINERIAYRVRNIASCADCATKPFADAEGLHVLECLSKHRTDVFNAIRESLASFETDAEKVNWISALPDELRHLVRRAQDDSHIQADHAIPRSVIAKIYERLTASEKRLVSNDLVIGLCGRCNRSRGNQLFSTPRLIELIVKTRQGISLEFERSTPVDAIRRLSDRVLSYERIEA